MKIRAWFLLGVGIALLSASTCTKSATPKIERPYYELLIIALDPQTREPVGAARIDNKHYEAEDDCRAAAEGFVKGILAYVATHPGTKLPPFAVGCHQAGPKEMETRT